MYMSELEQTLTAFRTELASAQSPEQIQELRTKFLGKKSYVKTALKSLGGMSAEERPTFAKAVNDAAQAIERELDEASARIANAAVAKQIEAEWQDLSMPGVAQERGAMHPLTQVNEVCMNVMRRLGFTLAEGPEVESPYYNFDALNIPENHPARDMQDTFWLPNNLLLRSHTTTVQARVLQSKPPLPIKVVSPGRTYRNEAVDATHLAMFHQFEGIWIEEGLTFGDLKGTLLEIARSVYGAQHKFRFKPKYYPYTEPSVGMDIQCAVCKGADENCRACGGGGWVTILGAGMVHPKVFLEFGYDHTKLSGIAFGLGISRIAAQAAGIRAIKPLYEQDLRVHRTIKRGGL
ncbi:MAG: phenylalanine--tRNA ligase subunit alpha [Acidobacteriota bacterium]|nr:phenylalanine--tRNA ligase subunit alpha [Acidobacteriota bacterium]